MEPEVSLLCSQEPAADPYPEAGESNPQLSTLFPLDTRNRPKNGGHYTIRNLVN
jgi:hypothetical protein